MPRCQPPPTDGAAQGWTGACRDLHRPMPIRWLMTDDGAVGLTAPWMAATPSRSAIAASPEPVTACCRAAAESAESPHCTALHVATVRYIVEEEMGCDLR